MAAPLVACAHLVIGLLLAGRLSLWGDEAFSAESVRLPWRDLLSMLTRIDVNMSAYYLFLKGWTFVFGSSEFALRVPSLLMSTATIVVAARLLSRWFGASAALVVAVALGFSPYFLAIGLTARPFAMLALTSVLALGIFVNALGTSRFATWALLAVVDVLALYTSLLGVLVIIAQVVYLVVADRRFRPAQLGSACLVVLGSVPALVYLAPGDTLNWLSTPNVSALVRVVSTVVGHRWGLVFVLLVALGLATRPRPTTEPLRLYPRARLLLPAFVVVPVALMFASLPKQSLFYPPYLVTVFVAAALLAGASMAALPRQWFTAATAALALALVAGVAVNFVPEPGLSRQDWRAAGTRLHDLVQPGDAVVFPNTYYRIAGEHYGRESGFTAAAIPRLPAVAWFSEPPDTYDRLKRTGVYRDRKLIDGGLVGIDRVWLVGPDDEWMDRFSTTLDRSRWITRREVVVPGLVVRLLVRDGRNPGSG